MLVHLEVLVVWHEFQVVSPARLSRERVWPARLSSKYGPSFIAQFSTNQLALSLGFPTRPPNSGDEVRFVLHGSSLTYRLLPVLCV